MPSQAASRRSSSHHTPSGSSHQHLGKKEGNTSMPEDPKYAIANNFFASMLHEVVIDTALRVHAKASRQKRAEGRARGGCPVCKASCQMSHDSASRQAEDRAIKTEAVEEGEGSSSQAGQESSAPPPKGLEMYQNNPLLACLVCSRQVSANRYAQHLASCVGVGKGGIARRKGKVGGASASAKDRMKIKTALENRKKANFQTQSNRNTPTPSSRPEQESMSGASDEESSSRKNKALANTLRLNGNGKRNLSPSREGRLESPKHAKHSTPPPGRQAPFMPSALGSSLPVTGSPLNPHRNNKAVHVIDDEEDENDNEEGEEEEEEEGDEEEGDEEEEEEEDDEEDEDEEEEEDDDDDDNVALANGQASHHTRTGSMADSFDEDDSVSDRSRSDNASLLSAAPNAKHTSSTTAGAGAIERSKGSDGEYIDVESASAHSEADDDF